jgi:hypothetical protein
MPALVSLLYYLCFLLLSGLAAFVLARRPRSSLHRTFGLGALALLAWTATLFLYGRAADPSLLTLLGRLNFAAALFVVLLAYLFVAQLAGRTVPSRRLWLETLLLAALTIWTPLIDQAEAIEANRHVTRFGTLFPLYVLHIVLYLLAALGSAFRARREAPPRQRSQLTLIALGMLATALVAVPANLILPYGFGNFAWQDVGALSTILFVAAVADAIFVHRLFDVRILVKRTLVYGLLLTFALSVYSSVVLLVTQYLTSGERSALTQFGVLVIAFSFDPLRRFLEKQVDGMLFPERRMGARPRTTGGHRG